MDAQQDINQLNSLSTADLAKESSAALVNLDNVMRASGDELSFAQAEFGLEATDPYTAALNAAKQQAAAAFAIQQKVGDTTVKLPEPEVRAMLMQVLELACQASGTLDAQSQSFEQLRDLENRAGDVLDDTDKRASEIEQRIPVSAQTLSTLATSYPGTALASVSGNPDHATALLSAARDAITKGRAALQAGQKSQAVGFARVAQNSIAQAAKLMDAVDGAPAALQQATATLQAHLASMASDVTDAQRYVSADPAVATVVAQAQAALQQAQAVSTGGDPIAALNQMAAAQTQLDTVLAADRNQAMAAQQAGTATQALLAQVQQVIQQADAYIDARRSAVDAGARTALAEASRLASVAQQSLATDPAGAYSAAQQAMANAQQAMAMAQQDAQTWQNQDEAQAYQNSGTGGSGIGGLVTGMLLGSLLGGPRVGMGPILPMGPRLPLAPRVGFGGFGGFGMGHPGGFHGGFGGGFHGGGFHAGGGHF